MIRLYYCLQKGGKTLSLCFSESGKPRKYKSVSNLLVGGFSVKNWNSKTCQFYKSPNSDINNQEINKFKKRYADVLEENPSISLEALYSYFDNKRIDSEQVNSIFDFIDMVINDEKMKPTGGCNYKCYEKLQKRLYEFEPYLKETTSKKMTFCALDETFCDAFKDWIIVKRKGDDYEGLTKLFVSLINRADKNKSVDFDKSKINKFKFTDRDINERICELPYTLTTEQIKVFANLDLTTVQGKYNIEKVQLFHDTCMLMLGTFMRPCDVILFKKENITNQSGKNFVRYVPKKKASISNKSKRKLATFPLTPEVEFIINKYAGQSDNNYILPLYSEERAQGLKDGKEGLLKQLNRNLNKWLKMVSGVMGLDPELCAYDFRHTSITHSLSIGKIPVITVSQWAGTSVEMIEKHYYNSSMDSSLPSAISGLYKVSA
ncbi:phage integrase SAM-like domain-containing protein [uncultured Bacteroides sp.]|uniref:phage integrase SAM-like domain-containing protein n=1 Tax=uncultured Bacteroides sp. TaxID=162156 RepID=UPI002AAADEF8|nr:phage integrase SAM-like domain-containing protein [uncultured Bacteroides sp.]